MPYQRCHVTPAGLPRRAVLALVVPALLCLVAVSVWGQDALPPAPTAAPAGTVAGQASHASGSAGRSGAQVKTEVIGSVSLVERLNQGGKTMWFLLGLSVVAVTFTVERAVRLRRSAVVPDGLTTQAKALWAQGDDEALLALCASKPSTLATIIQAFVRHRHCSFLELSALAGDLAGRDMRRHLQKAYPIAVVATLSPLLGLLGTVVGMIESFEMVAIAGSLGDASLLAGGISKALVTTATGLVIAVPALGLFHLFRSRTNALTMALEGEVHELLTSWFMDRAPSRAGQERG